MAVIIILWVKNKDQAFSWFSESYYSSTEFFEYPQNLDEDTYLLTYLLSHVIKTECEISFIHFKKDFPEKFDVSSKII